MRSTVLMRLAGGWACFDDLNRQPFATFELNVNVWFDGRLSWHRQFFAQIRDSHLVPPKGESIHEQALNLVHHDEVLTRDSAVLRFVFALPFVFRIETV